MTEKMWKKFVDNLINNYHGNEEEILNDFEIAKSKPIETVYYKDGDKYIELQSKRIICSWNQKNKKYIKYDIEKVFLHTILKQNLIFPVKNRIFRKEDFERINAICNQYNIKLIETDNISDFFK